MAAYSYPLILKELSGDKVGVSFPDIKDLNFESDSIGKVCELAKIELTNFIKNAIKDGKELPNPTPEKALQITQGEYIILIDIEI